MRKYKNNIILFSRNITSHFAGKAKIITLFPAIIILSFVNITLRFPNIFNSSNVSALSYQSNVGVSFTFNPTLSVNISPSDLVISNLTPGTTSDSNIINVSVATNASYGYTLSTIVNGDNNDLAHSNGTDIFSSIATDASLPSLTADNTWGYSYKNNLASNPTWSSYSGLSSSNSAILLDTNTNNIETGIDSIDFKIGAKAASTQASGTYTGVINFTAVTKPKPKEITDLEFLQDFADLDEVNLASVKSSMPINSTFILKDKRDEQEYTIAKLADDKIWMTKNLNLAGGTEITSELSDVPEDYVLPVANGFQEGNRLPESSSSYSDNSRAYVYNSSNETCSANNPCYSYYSYVAAVSGSGIGLSQDGENAPYSICPRGWKLPTSGAKANNAGLFDFYNLAAAYKNNFFEQAGPGTTANFLLSGFSNIYVGTYGYYWSSTVNSSTHAYYAMINSSGINPGWVDSRRYESAVRCLAR